MKKVFAYLSLFLSFIFITLGTAAQTIEISAEIRPRFEYRHGYKSLFPDGKDPAVFVSQRTRLNGFFANPTFKAYLSLQDVRVWGDVGQLNTGDVNGFSVHEAWGQVFLGDHVFLKIGRQEVIYDDHRIFGSVGWAQQARSHDAAIVGILPSENHKIEVGLAYNAMQESLYRMIYTNSNYKTFQLVHYHGEFGKSGLSILFLNNGMAYDGDPDTATYSEKISYSQTFGGRYTFAGDKIKFNLASYYQGGKNSAHRDLSAFYFAGDVAFRLISNFSFGLGGEYLSGTPTKDQGNPVEKDRSFTPLYGTNHKFNGWMDYFYVGNHSANVGLIDIFLPLSLKVQKVTFTLVPHYFLSAATVSENIEVTRSINEWKDHSSGLGTEIDFSIGYGITKGVNIAGGYSQMLATETMQVLKGGNYKNYNGWAWVMVTFQPTLYSKE